MDVKRTEMLTSCSRRVVTGRFRVPAASGIERVVLRIGDGEDTVWAALTADEARTLAESLIKAANGIR